jgi:hypothetical protein
VSDVQQLRGSSVCGLQFLQHSTTEKVGVELAGPCRPDDFGHDDFGHGVFDPTLQAERFTHFLEGGPHGLYVLGIRHML